MSMFRNLLTASQLDSALTFNIVASEGADTLSVNINGRGALFVDWGDGSPITRVNILTTHIYAYGEYVVRLTCDGTSNGYNYIKLDSSTVNIRSSNERWSVIPGLCAISCVGCANSELAFTSLPGVDNPTYSYNGAFNGASAALLPLRKFPVTRGVNSFAANCREAILPFNELPDTVTGNIANAFVNNVKATFTITRIPEGVTSMNGAFQSCKLATIRLSRLPASVTSMSGTFAYSSLVMDLDEVAANAPDGGYAALTNLSSAFTDCAGVTGSRSRFLAACPNATTNNYTFSGTNTTE